MERKAFTSRLKEALASKVAVFLSGVALAIVLSALVFRNPEGAGSHSDLSKSGHGAGHGSGKGSERTVASKAPAHGAHSEHGAPAEHGEATEHGAATESEHALEAKAEHGVDQKDEHKSEHKAEHHAEHGGRIGRFFAAYRSLFGSIQTKVEEIRHLEVENHQLALENASLRKQGEALRFSCQTASAKNVTKKIADRLSAETWADMGRSLASIRYEMPANLLPKQLYVLAINFFRGHEDEKTARILTFLTGMEDDPTYKTAEAYLMTGISWYRLDHLKEADRYFDLVLKTEKEDANLPYQAQARLWRAVISQRKADRKSAQRYLAELMDFHPRAPEVEWVNDSNAKRQIASKPTVHVLESEIPVEEDHDGHSHKTH